MDKKKFEEMQAICRDKLNNVIPINATYPIMNKLERKNNNVTNSNLAENADFMKTQTDENEK